MSAAPDINFDLSAWREEMRKKGYSDEQINAMPLEDNPFISDPPPPVEPPKASNGTSNGKPDDLLKDAVKAGEKKATKKKRSVLTRDVIRQIVDDIKQKTNLSDAINHFGGAELGGVVGDEIHGWHKAHESKSKSSLHVNDTKGVWNCKNCGQDGDVIEWVGYQRHGNGWKRSDMAQFTPILKELANFAGVKVPEEELTEEDIAAYKERRTIEDIFGLYTDFCHGELTPERRKYFHDRGFTDETIDKYKLGWAPASKTATFAYLRKVHKIAAEDLLKTGLFKKWPNGGGYEDFFQGRYMFPYWNRGKAVYFIGRMTDESPAWEREGREMKYRKLPVHNDSHPYVSETVRNDFFYGEDDVRGNDTMFITEGVADCIAANQAGFPCVSPVTVQFDKKSHPKLIEIARKASEVYIANDNETNEAGKKGTIATAEALWHAGIVVKMITLPRPEGVDKVDLNDYLKDQGPEAFKALLPSAKTLLDLYIEEAAGLDRQSNESLAIGRKILRLLAYIDDPLKLDAYKEKVCNKLNIGRQAFKKMLGMMKEELAEERAKAANKNKSPEDPADKPELPDTWPYIIYNGQLGVQSIITVDGDEVITTSAIARFSAQIVEESFDEEGEPTYVLKGKSPGRGDFTTEILAKEFTENRLLKAVVESAAGPHDPVYVGMGEHLGPAIKILSPKDVKRTQRRHRTGWDGGIFLIPGRERPGTKIDFPHQLPYSVDVNADAEKALKGLEALMKTLPDIYAPVVAGAVFGAAAARLAGWHNDRYGVFLKAQTGSQKTEYAKLFMSIFGVGFLDNDNLLRWGMGATANAILHVATHTRDLPLLIDNYKSNTGEGPKAFVSLIQGLMEGGEKLRMERSKNKLRDSDPIGAWLVCTGEDFPENDPATTARMLIAQLQKNNSVDIPELTEAQKYGPYLSAIGNIWINWLESEEGREAAQKAGEALAAKRTEWAKYLFGVSPKMPNPHRIATTLAVNTLSFALAAVHPIFGHILQPYLEPHVVGLKKIANAMSTFATDGLEARRFVVAVQELLSTGRAILIQNKTHHDNMPPSDRDRVIGWCDPDKPGAAYLHPTITRNMVSRLIGDNLSEMSSAALYAQLEQLGLLESKARDGVLVQKKLTGKNDRYLHLAVCALAPPDEI